jgi:hypothetical protein
MICAVLCGTLGCSSSGMDAVHPGGPGADAGSGAMTPDASPPSCNGSTDLMGDAHNCGHCGHDCQGGTCSAGACQAVTLYGGSGTIWDLAIDSANVYWTTNQQVVSIPLGGGRPRVLADGQANARHLAVDDHAVYWTTFADPSRDGGQVMTVPLGGGTPAVLAGGQVGPFGITVDAANVYWVTLIGGTVMKVGKQGGAPTTLVMGLTPNYPTTIAVDATHVYWTNSANHPDGAIMRVPLAGGKADVLATGELQAIAITLTADTVYWTNFDNPSRLVSVGKDGTGLHELVRGLDFGSGIAIDGSTLYFTSLGGGGSVQKVTLGGDGTVTTLAYNQGQPAFIKADAKALYWADLGGSILKLAR